jgi:hypothetical protein
MNIPNFESKPEIKPLSPESFDRLQLINDTNRQLEKLSDFGLETADGRLGLKVALDIVFSNIDKIEGGESQGEAEYEVVGVIKDRIRELYKQLYAIKYPDTKSEQDKVEFYSEIEEIMETIESRGQRFIEDMEEFQSFNNQDKMSA